MKKIFFFFAMFVNIAASAQNMQVESISATYTSTPVVKFRVSWTGAREYRHNTKVWVFVDYRKVENNVPAGNWARALVASTPTVSSSPASTVTLESGNDKGFWLQGANGDYSATVTVPVTLDASVTQFNWCAYASDYPPNAKITSGSYANGTYTLKGTQPFIINGTVTVNSNTYSAERISTITDVTKCPGYRCRLRDEAVGTVGCCTGLTAIGNYCRDLVADNASTITSCNIEIKRTNQGTITSYGGENYLCDAGWRYPDTTEGLCLCANWATLGFVDLGEKKHDVIIQGSTVTNPAIFYRESGYCYSAATASPWTQYAQAGAYVQVRCVRN
jgi:hypothetical protein